MKDISIYFRGNNHSQKYKSGQVGEIVEFASDQSFSLPEAGSIAIFYVPEYRNANREMNADWVEDFRNALGELYCGEWQADIYDLGMIQPGERVEDTFVAVKDVVTELIKGDVFPILIGGSQDLTYAVYQAYEKLEQTVNMLDVDASLDLGEIENPIEDDSWLNKIILHKPNYLFNYSLFGYQSYLVNPKEKDLLDQMYFDTFRLGDFYANEKMVEPQLRNTDILSFDLNAIRSSDYKNNSRNLPNGLYGEDACKIMRYAGISDKLTSLGIFNLYTSNAQGYLSDLNLIAQMIWYFIEGFNLRKKDYPIGTKANYLKYRVSIDDFKDEVVFYKSDKSGRWWMEVPYPKTKEIKLQRHLLVPCNYEDYQNALRNELPDLWIKTFKKLS